MRRGSHSGALFSDYIRVLRECVFQETDIDLIFAEESGHARFDLFQSSQRISLCDLVVLPGVGSRIRDAHRQPASERLARFRQKVWASLLSVPRVLADAQLLWPKVQG
jgi:hypothetical protein